MQSLYNGPGYCCCFAHPLWQYPKWYNCLLKSRKKGKLWKYSIVRAASMPRETNNFSLKPKLQSWTLNYISSCCSGQPRTLFFGAWNWAASSFELFPESSVSIAYIPFFLFISMLDGYACAFSNSSAISAEHLYNIWASCQPFCNLVLSYGKLYLIGITS